MTPPVLSIVIPVFNAEKTLERCVDSILAQTFTDYEIILINDGSTDSSKRICEKLAAHDNRIRVFNQSNQGASAARNVGLDNATGEWIAFIDADDFISQSFFPHVFSEDNDLYLQNEEFVGQGTPPDDYLTPGLFFGESLDYFFKENLHKHILRSICCKFIKRSIVEQQSLRFDPIIRLGEDTLFFMEYYLHCMTATVLGTSIYYYYRPGTQWENKYRCSIKEAEYYFTTFMKIYNRFQQPSPKMAKIMYDLYVGTLDETDLQSIEWKISPAVLKIKKTQLSYYTPKYKFRFHVARAFSFFRFIFQ